MKSLENSLLVRLAEEKSDLLVSYDFNSLYPSAQADKDGTWPAIETAYLFKIYMSDTVREIFVSGRWN